MTESLRPWWRNCALEVDAEIRNIDRLEDGISPLDPEVSGMRELIATLEMCHHKADRWVDNIIGAIGGDKAKKGLGTRSPGLCHPAEKIWQNACAALSAWCAGRPCASIDLSVGTLPAARLLASLGERSPLKEWQVQRVVDKIRNLIHWPLSDEDPSAQYGWILLGGDEGDLGYRRECPEYYREHRDFWLATARTIIQDTLGGKIAELSLGLAIDMLWPCHWRFIDNLKIVLAAIGGKLDSEEPYTACSRNIALVPIREQMKSVVNSLNHFAGEGETEGDADESILSRLGDPSEVKKWLAASLSKTIRLQLDPPTAVRTASALDGPD